MLVEKSNCLSVAQKKEDGLKVRQLPSYRSSIKMVDEALAIAEGSTQCDWLTASWEIDSQEPVDELSRLSPSRPSDLLWGC